MNPLSSNKLSLQFQPFHGENWDQVGVEKTRGIANVYTHVGRVIGLLGRKNTILHGILPIDYFICNQNGSQETATPMINFCPRFQVENYTGYLQA